MNARYKDCINEISSKCFNNRRTIRVMNILIIGKIKIDKFNFFSLFKSVPNPTENKRKAIPILASISISGVFGTTPKITGPIIIPVKIKASMVGCFSLLNIYAITVAARIIIENSIKKDAKAGSIFYSYFLF
jgi:hypothetical protein